jgi:hypothetical protein
MMSHRILPENTTITIWTEMPVKISFTNLVSNMNSYLWKLSREYLDASPPQRKTEAPPENRKINHFDPQVQSSFPNLVSKH